MWKPVNSSQERQLGSRPAWPILSQESKNRGVPGAGGRVTMEAKRRVAARRTEASGCRKRGHRRCRTWPNLGAHVPPLGQRCSCSSSCITLPARRMCAIEDTVSQTQVSATARGGSPGSPAAGLSSSASRSVAQSARCMCCMSSSDLLASTSAAGSSASADTARTSSWESCTEAERQL